MKSITKIEDDIQEQIKAELGVFMDEPHPDRSLDEIVSGVMGNISHSEAIELFAEDHSLGELTDYSEGVASGCIPIIRANIQCNLEQHARGELQRLKDEFESDKADLESEGWDVERVKDLINNCHKYYISYPANAPTTMEPFKSVFDAWNWLRDQPQTWFDLYEKEKS